MNALSIQQIISKQQAFFKKGLSFSLSFRIHALKRLRKAIISHEQEIYAALQADLGKSSFEAYMSEIGMLLEEINHMIRHISSYARIKPVLTPPSQFPAKSYIKPVPYGTVLIMSPWNYPLLLTLSPLVDALAAGNTAILKPSAYSPHTATLLKKIIQSCFPSSYVAVITGGRKENKALLEQKFDYIFFTGSQSVGKEVLKHAAVHLTPVTLELGGKSPCIVDRTADLKLAARRIVFGKFLNCGQTCVAPDYIYCHTSVQNALVKEIKKEIVRQYGVYPLENPNYGKIVNKKHFDRLSSLLLPEKIIFGGNTKRDTLQIEPTMLLPITWDDRIMQEEIFGPLLPVLTFSSHSEVIEHMHTLAPPLAFYIFTKNKIQAKQLIQSCMFGGGCINDTIIHLATTHMGFGGVGASGMGAYHGKTGFDTFSHKKSIVDKYTWLDIPLRYQPYNTLAEKILHVFFHQ